MGSDRRAKGFVAALALFACCDTARAEWKGKAEAGIVLARGNTETETLNGRLDMQNELERWKHSAFLLALSASTSSETTAERYEARWQSDYRITPRAFWFGGLRYENDRFSGFRYQASVTTGLGYRFIETERTKLSAQAGVGLRRLEDSITGEETDETIFRGDLAYEHQLTDTTKIIDRVIVESGSENTFVGNDLAIEVNINDKFALSVGYGIRYNTDPPPELRSTDRLTTVNLVYSF
jgi:putative salt-induced outer membrane protein